MWHNNESLVWPSESTTNWSFCITRYWDGKYCLCKKRKRLKLFWKFSKNSFTQNINLTSSDIAAYNTQQMQDVNKLQYPHFNFKSWNSFFMCNKTFTFLGPHAVCCFTVACFGCSFTILWSNLNYTQPKTL